MLSIQPKRAGDRLLVQCRLTNDDETAIYAANLTMDNHRFGQSDTSSPLRPHNNDSGLAHCRFAGDDTLVLFQGQVRPSLDYAGDFPPFPLFSKVEPGQTIVWTIRQPLPVLEWHTYAAPKKEATTSRTAKRVKLALHLIPSSEVSYLLPIGRVSGAFSGAHERTHAARHRHQPASKRRERARPGR